MKLRVTTISYEGVREKVFGIGQDTDFANVDKALNYLYKCYGKDDYHDGKELQWQSDEEDVFASFEDNDLRIGDEVRSYDLSSPYHFERGIIVDSYWSAFHRYYVVEIDFTHEERIFRSKDLRKRF